MLTKDRVGPALAIVAAIVGLVLMFSGHGSGEGNDDDAPGTPPPSSQVAPAPPGQLAPAPGGQVQQPAPAQTQAPAPAQPDNDGDDDD